MVPGSTGEENCCGVVAELMGCVATALALAASVVQVRARASLMILGCYHP